MEDIKKHLRPVLAGILFYSILKFSPFLGIVHSGLFSAIAVYFLHCFIAFLPLPYIAGDRRKGLIAGLVAVFAFTFQTKTYLFFNDFFSSSWLVVLSCYIGVISANLLIRELFSGKSDKDFTKSLKQDPESALVRKRGVVLSLAHRDDSTVSVDSVTTDKMITVGDSTTFVPHTTYTFRNNEKKVQDIWYKDDKGEEKKLRLINIEIDAREGHELELIYTSHGPLEYIKNHNTGVTVPIYNYVFDYKVINASDVIARLLFSIASAIPFIGALLSFFSITTSYSFLNKPFKRSYLGKSTLIASIFATAISALFSLAVYSRFSTGNLSFEFTLKGIIVVALAIMIAQSIALFLVSWRSKKMEKKLVNLI